MKKSFHKGFTLIELLIVVAIIALLSATILASLGSARTKAKDARTTSELSSMRAQAELYSGNHFFSYGSSTTLATGSTATVACTTTNSIFDTAATDGIANLLKDVVANASGFDVSCANTPTSWVVSAKLQAGPVFCVDSNGTSKQEAATQSTSVSAISSGQCL